VARNVWNIGLATHTNVFMLSAVGQSEGGSAYSRLGESFLFSFTHCKLPIQQLYPSTIFDLFHVKLVARSHVSIRHMRNLPEHHA